MGKTAIGYYHHVCQSTGQKKRDPEAGWQGFSTREEEQNFNSDCQHPWEKYEGLWKVISIIAIF